MWNKNLICYNQIYFNGYLGLITFFISAMCYSNLMMLSIYYSINIWYFNWIQLVIYSAFIILLKIIYNLQIYNVFIRAFFLGYTFISGITFYILAVESWKIFGIYITVLSAFHLTEFLAIAFTNPMVVSAESFIINHSFSYTLAAAASWIEFFLESNYFPILKDNMWIPLIGLFFCLIGELFRKAAIFTAKQNFNHVIQNKKINDHKLITHGVYSICRHPSYVGWFYWSLGTQLILQNPICLLIYTSTAWKFFYNRIYIEELSLLEFFGIYYLQYQKQVSTGLPFIFGYKHS